MDLLKVESVSPVTLPKTLPQLVPSAACVRCDVCCHFPERDSFLRPYFTPAEIDAAVAAGIDPGSFPDRGGSQISLVKHPAGEGYVCPAFDPGASRCTIYEVRPLDCQLYPLALMWDAAHRTVVLGWDTKCPFMIEALPPVIAAHVDRVSALLADDETLDVLAAHPRLIGPFQDDVIVVKELPGLTARVASRMDPRLRPLTAGDVTRVTRALELSGLAEWDALAAYAFPYHYMWTAVMPYWWMEHDDTYYLFAQSPDGFFMPLLPLGPKPLADSVKVAFALMRQWNGASPVSRIENIMRPQKEVLQKAGYRVEPKGGDYLYDAGALGALTGDPYKSQRALCNRVEREQTAVIEAYREADRMECRALYERWSRQKETGVLEPVGRLFLEDAEAAHDSLLKDAHRTGVTGTVARVSGALVAYTFGYWLTPQTYCVLCEIADRSIPGLAQYLFRDTCRTAVSHGASWINAMDDSGLAGLRAAKRAYRPERVIENWVLTGLQP